MEKILMEIVKYDPTTLHTYLRNYLIEKGYKNIVSSKDEYLYASGDIPFVVVAHLDTVHKDLPEKIFFDEKQRVLWSPQGIGGDDRAGVYAILKVLEHCKPHVLFLHEEEVGGYGAQTAGTELFIKDINFMIEFDRAGDNDAVFYECGNQEFKDHIEAYGFKETWGTFTDITVIGPMWDVAGVNLSIGYYNAHTRYEYIDLNVLDYTVERAIEILKTSNHNVKYDYQYVDHRTKYYYPNDFYYSEDEFNEKDYESLFTEKSMEIIEHILNKKDDIQDTEDKWKEIEENVEKIEDK